MAQYSKIEWTERTWNPSTGCTKISPGCLNCYASSLAARLNAMGVAKYRQGFKFTIHPAELRKPLEWKRPSVIFVNSMSDLFHEDMPDDFLEKIIQTMSDCDQHIFQVLTKRADRMLDFLQSREILRHVWVGVTVENKKNEYRIDLLRKIKAAVRFLSIEPMLEALPNLNLQGIDWVIVGGESGRNARPIHKEWIEDIQRQCEAQKTHFFFKQWGGLRKKQNGNLLNGRLYQEYPPDYEKWQQLLNDQYESGALYR